MGWRIRVRHSTGYRYDTPVHQSYNEVRLTPRTDSRQNVIVSRVETTPATRLYRYTDYWGTAVTAFDLHAPHKELAVVATSVVETGDTQPPVAHRGLAGPGRRRGPRPAHRDAGVHRLRRRATRSWRRSRGCCARRRRPSRPCTRRARWVHEHLTYQPGSTGVHTSALEAWEAGKGVCQDYVHLTLLLLREAGIPARYVSGYLLPKANAEVKQTVTGESHAWVEAWTGGWWGYDPTNLIEIGQRHVWVASGRDYHDVPPLKGVYSGGTASALDVTVDMTRLA